MSVLFTNARLAVRRRGADGRDAHGEPTPGALAAATLSERGRVAERADGGWDLGLDPALWPVRVGDVIVDTTGRSWHVQTAQLIRNAHDESVDWVRVTALQRTPDGTEPGGPEFVGRG